MDMFQTAAQHASLYTALGYLNARTSILPVLQQKCNAPVAAMVSRVSDRRLTHAANAVSMLLHALPRPILQKVVSDWIVPGMLLLLLLLLDPMRLIFGRRIKDIPLPLATRSDF